MSLCVYVCMYVCMCVCMYVRAYVRACVRVISFRDEISRMKNGVDFVGVPIEASWWEYDLKEVSWKSVKPYLFLIKKCKKVDFRISWKGFIRSVRCTSKRLVIYMIWKKFHENRFSRFFLSKNVINGKLFVWTSRVALTHLTACF